jgi:exosortase
VALPSLRPVGLRLPAARGISLRAVAVVGLVLLAYNYSLLTLARGLGLQTPLAYLALVPVIAIVLAAIRLRLEPRGLPIHDRQVDWIVGLGLIGVAAAVLILVPSPTSSSFWLQRLDLLTLPVFVAGLITLLFGVRRTWTLKGPIAFLLLAWPLPYVAFLSGAMGQFTEFTANIVAAITRVLPIARPSLADDTLFVVGTGSRAFSVSIGAACAGVNSFIGFLLIGVAFLLVVRGSVVRRALWLATGLTMVFALNILRIVAILLAGATLGQAAAFEILHPVAGLLVFNLGVIAMVAMAPRFGLRFVGPSKPSGPGESREGSAVRHVRPALLVAFGLAAVLAATNATYARFEAISNGLGEARLTSFDVRDARLPGWESRLISVFPQAKQYFGSSATWDRVSYWSGPSASLTSTRSIYVDVITTDDAGSFADYSLLACYRFHGYNIASDTTAEIGAGVTAHVINWVNTKVVSDWSALSWEWPYLEKGRTRYERVTVLLREGPTTEFSGVDAPDVTSQAPRFTESNRFLVTLGREIVRTQLQTAKR